MERTWTVHAADDFLGYVYAVEVSDALDKAIIKHGAPGKWGIDQYTITKIKWAEEGEIE